MMALLGPVLTKVAKSQEVMKIDFYSQLLDTNCVLIFIPPGILFIIFVLDTIHLKIGVLKQKTRVVMGL